MTIFKAICCILFTSFAVHYGWRMRGTVVGGEKGAMVPGLFAGLSLALFAGGGIREYFWIPAAAGLIGMTYGGIEPYGDNITNVRDPESIHYNPKKGYLSLMLKGALWFSIGGGFIGLALSAMSGMYPLRNIIIFPFMTVILQSIGFGIFNYPYDKEKQIYPKIYLTYESRDEWGSNVGVLLSVIIMALLNKDTLPLVISGFGFLFGAIGWFVAMKIYKYTEEPKKNGKYLFGVFSRKKLLGGWGNMEYTLGSFGGFGIALGFVLCQGKIESINSQIEANGIFNPLGGINGSCVIIAMAVIFAALLVINALEYSWDENGKKYSSFMMDCIERPFFNTIPFVPVLLCSVEAARLMTVFMVLYALCLKTWFNRFEKGKVRNIYIAVSGLICVAAFISDILSDGFPPVALFIAGGIPYVISEVVWYVTTPKRDGWNGLKTLNSFSFGTLLLTVQSTAVAVIGYFISKI